MQNKDQYFEEEMVRNEGQRNVLNRYNIECNQIMWSNCNGNNDERSNREKCTKLTNIIMIKNKLPTFLREFIQLTN